MGDRPDVPSGRRSAWLRPLAVLSIGLLLAACTASRDDRSTTGGTVRMTGPEGVTPGSVVVIGDSLTAGASAAIAEALPDAGYEPLAVDGVPGRRTTVSAEGGQTSGVEALEDAQAAGLEPAVWVVALGTNDVPHYDDAEDYGALISQLMSAIPDGAAVVWVDVYLRDLPDGADAFNSMLHLLLDSRPETVVASWSDAAPTEGVLTDDGVHPTNAGHLVFAATIVDGLDALVS